MAQCKCCSSDKLDFTTKEVNSILRDGVINVSLRYREGYWDPIDQLTLEEAIEKVPQDYRSPLRVIQFLNKESYNEMWTWRGTDVEKEWGDVNFWVKFTDDNTIVNESHLEDGAVTTLKVAEGAITKEKLSQELQDTLANKAVVFIFEPYLGPTALENIPKLIQEYKTDKNKSVFLVYKDGIYFSTELITEEGSEAIIFYQAEGANLRKFILRATGKEEVLIYGDTVRYGKQTLTDVQKVQARKNLNVLEVTQQDIDNLPGGALGPISDNTTPKVQKVKNLLGFDENGELGKVETISGENLADGAVSQTKIADGAVTTSKIQDVAVTEAKLASQSVSSVKIKDRTIGAAKLGANSITTSKIQNKAVTADKLADGVQPLVVDYNTEVVLDKSIFDLYFIEVNDGRALRYKGKPILLYHYSNQGALGALSGFYNLGWADGDNWSYVLDFIFIGLGGRGMDFGDAVFHKVLLTKSAGVYRIGKGVAPSYSLDINMFGNVSGHFVRNVDNVSKWAGESLTTLGSKWVPYIYDRHSSAYLIPVPHLTQGQYDALVAAVNSKYPGAITETALIRKAYASLTSSQDIWVGDDISYIKVVIVGLKMYYMGD